MCKGSAFLLISNIIYVFFTFAEAQVGNITENV